MPVCVRPPPFGEYRVQSHEVTDDGGRQRARQDEGRHRVVGRLSATKTAEPGGK